MRLIDLDELLKYPIRLNHYDKEHGNVHFVYGVESVLEYAEYLPTIEAEPVRHGRWIYEGKRGRFPACRCSECGNVENADWAILGDNVNYCPNCGARMDEVTECGQ